MGWGAVGGAGAAFRLGWVRGWSGGWCRCGASGAGPRTVYLRRRWSEACGARRAIGATNTRQRPGPHPCDPAPPPRRRPHPGGTSPGRSRVDPTGRDSPPHPQGPATGPMATTRRKGPKPAAAGRGWTGGRRPPVGSRDSTGGGGVAGVGPWTLTCICGANSSFTTRSTSAAPKIYGPGPRPGGPAPAPTTEPRRTHPHPGYRPVRPSASAPPLSATISATVWGFRTSAKRIPSPSGAKPYPYTPGLGRLL